MIPQHHVIMATPNSGICSRGWRFVASLLFFGVIFANDGFCGRATLKVTVRGVEQPSAEERLAFCAEAKTDKEAGGLVDALLSKFKKQDLSGIAVTVRSDFLPQKITKRTDKDGVVPLISEGMVEKAKRYNSVLNKLRSKSADKPLRVEKAPPFLPKSKGDVIFLPDIVIGGDEPRPPAAAKDPKTKQ